MTETNNFDGLLDRASHDFINTLIAEGSLGKAQLTAALMLEANPSDLTAWSSLARALTIDEKSELARAAYTGLVEAHRRRGDLPMALVTILSAREVDIGDRALLDALAGTFSAKAPSLKDDWKPSPPAVPRQLEVDLSAADSEETVEQAILEALDKARLSSEAVDEAENRFYPIFGSLSAEAFIRFASHLELRPVKRGELIVEHGDPGESFFIIASGEARVFRKSSTTGDETLLARLGAGAFFGEMSIVTSAPRAASVSAESDSVLLRADMNVMKREMRKLSELERVLHAFCRARMLENVVVASDIIRRIPKDERAELLSKFREHRSAAGSTLISEGESSEGLFLLVSGEVVVTKEEEGDQLTLARLGAGDFFGEISLVLRRPAVATVKATTEVVALKLHYDTFREAVKAHPNLLTELYETAVEREEETASILALEAESADDLILV